MRIYRGPDSKPFYDDTHQFVFRISPAQLRKGIEDDALIRFKIGKNAKERHAVCTAKFEDDDIVPIMAGLLARLEAHQTCLAKIRAVLKEAGTPESKIKAVQKALWDL
jgi:hypothetical protein